MSENPKREVPRRKLLWIKCYSRLEPSELLSMPLPLFLNHNFLTCGRRHWAMLRFASATCICERGLTVTDHSSTHIDILWAEIKWKEKQDSARSIEDVRAALFNVHELQYNSTGDLKSPVSMTCFKKYECNDIVVVSFMTSRRVDSWARRCAWGETRAGRW